MNYRGIGHSEPLISSHVLVARPWVYSTCDLPSQTPTMIIDTRTHFWSTVFSEIILGSFTRCWRGERPQEFQGTTPTYLNRDDPFRSSHSIRVVSRVQTRETMRKSSERTKKMANRRDHPDDTVAKLPNPASGGPNMVSWDLVVTSSHCPRRSSPQPPFHARVSMAWARHSRYCPDSTCVQVNHLETPRVKTSASILGFFDDVGPSITIYGN